MKKLGYLLGLIVFAGLLITLQTATNMKEIVYSQECVIAFFVMFMCIYLFTYRKILKGNSRREDKSLKFILIAFSILISYTVYLSVLFLNLNANPRNTELVTGNLITSELKNEDCEYFDYSLPEKVEIGKEYCKSDMKTAFENKTIQIQKVHGRLGINYYKFLDTSH